MKRILIIICICITVSSCTLSNGIDWKKEWEDEHQENYKLGDSIIDLRYKIISLESELRIYKMVDSASKTWK